MKTLNITKLRNASIVLVVNAQEGRAVRASYRYVPGNKDIKFWNLDMTNDGETPAEAIDNNAVALGVVASTIDSMVERKQNNVFFSVPSAIAPRFYEVIKWMKQGLSGEALKEKCIKDWMYKQKDG